MAQTWHETLDASASLTQIKSDVSENNATIRNLFAGATAPATPAPVAGQPWFDTVAGLLKIYSGTAWLPVTVGGVEVFTSSDSIAIGDLVNFHISSGFKARRANAGTGSMAGIAEGVAITAATSGNPIYVSVAPCKFTKVAHLLTPGDTLYLSGATPGGVTATIPSTTGHTLQVVGKVIDANTILWFGRGNPILLG